MYRYIVFLNITMALLLCYCGGDEIIFSLYGDNPQPLSILSIKVIDVETLKVTLSDEIDTNSAAIVSNYIITTADETDTITVLYASQEEADLSQIVLITDPFDPAKIYTLTIVNLTSQNSLPIPAEGLQALFSGKNVEIIDTSPPNYILPVDNSEIISQNVLLHWTSRVGAAKYYLEIASDSSFTSQITGSPFETTSNEYLFTPESDLTYYWRVRADITNENEYSNIAGEFFKFHIIRDTIYVYCPEGEICSNDRGIGNIGSPLYMISNAITKAQHQGINTIKVAARENNGEYQESTINLVEGISIYGGYTTDFQDSLRDINTNETIVRGSLQSSGITIMTSNIILPTTLDGFTIYTTDNSSFSNGIKLINCSSDLIISNNRIISGIAQSLSAGIYITGGNPTISDNTIISGNAIESYGIFITNSDGFIISNTITGGNAENSYGISIFQCSSTTIDGNFISGAVAATTSAGIYNWYSTGPNNITNNTINGGQSLDKSCGIYSSNGAASITGNTINGGIAPKSYGIYYDNYVEAESIISDNTITSGSGTSVSESCGICGYFAGWTESYDSLISDNSIHAGQSTDINYGCYVYTVFDSTLTLRNNYVTVEPAQNISYGIRARYTNTLLESNIVVSGQANDSYGMYLQSSKAYNNIIISGNAVNSSIGLYIKYLSTAVPCYVANNTIKVGEAANSYGVFCSSASHHLIWNNIIFSASVSGNIYGIYEESNSSPTVVDANIIFQTPTALYYDYDSSPNQLTEICQGLDTLGASGTFGDSDCNPILTTPLGTDNLNPSGTADVFNTGFLQTDISTWLILPNGPADLDNSSGWTLGDIGADTINCGIQD